MVGIYNRNFHDELKPLFFNYLQNHSNVNNSPEVMVLNIQIVFYNLHQWKNIDMIP